MRTFIAIELPGQIKDTLEKLQNQLKNAGADVKWVNPRNIHLTLKFLGEINQEELTKIHSILENTCEPKTSFYLRLSSIGAFPYISAPRIIWAGIDKGEKETTEIAEILNCELDKMGIPKETRGFSSHITIGRVKSNLNRHKLTQALNESKKEPDKNAEFLVTRITLFKSTLTATGPIYEPLKKVNLKTI